MTKYVIVAWLIVTLLFSTTAFSAEFIWKLRVSYLTTNETKEFQVPRDGGQFNIIEKIVCMTSPIEDKSTTQKAIESTALACVQVGKNSGPTGTSRVCAIGRTTGIPEHWGGQWDFYDINVKKLITIQVICETP